MHLIIRAALIYAFVFVLMRISGKRQFSELSPFDFVMLLILSEGVSQGLYGGDDFSLTSSLLLVTTFVALDILVSHIKSWFPRLDHVLEGVPAVLVDEGQIIEKTLKAERVQEEDILESARVAFGIEDMGQIKYAILEKGGRISIIPRKLPYV
jgi:uncharacterized membrane protein YcaP (DUF421 family)